MELDRLCNSLSIKFESIKVNFNKLFIPLQMYYPNKEAAMADAVRGKSRAVLIFPANFSLSLQERVRDPRHADNYTVMASEIEVHMDDTGEYFLNSNIKEHLCSESQQLLQIFLYYILLSLGFKKNTYHYVRKFYK